MVSRCVCVFGTCVCVSVDNSDTRAFLIIDVFMPYLLCKLNYYTLLWGCDNAENLSAVS